MSSLLEDFHRLADLPVHKALTGHYFIPRALCVLEEMGETKEAIHHLQGLLRTVANPKALRDSSLHLLKEMMDTRYTISSLCLAFGWDEEEAYQEVCRSNYTKVSDGYELGGNGKVLKGPNYEPANLTACIPCAKEAEANAMTFEAPLVPETPTITRDELSALRAANYWNVIDYDRYPRYCGACGAGTSVGSVGDHCGLGGNCQGTYRALEKPKVLGVQEEPRGSQGALQELTWGAMVGNPCLKCGKDYIYCWCYDDQAFPKTPKGVEEWYQTACVPKTPAESKESLRSLIKSVLIKDIGAMGSSRFRRILDQLEAAVTGDE